MVECTSRYVILVKREVPAAEAAAQAIVRRDILDGALDLKNHDA